MLTLHAAVVSLLHPFAPMFQARTWSIVQVLLVGAVLATRNRNRHLWFDSGTFCMSSQKPDMREIPKPMLNRFMESLTYAA